MARTALLPDQTSPQPQKSTYPQNAITRSKLPTSKPYKRPYVRPYSWPGHASSHKKTPPTRTPSRNSSPPPHFPTPYLPARLSSPTPHPLIKPPAPAPGSNPPLIHLSPHRPRSQRLCRSRRACACVQIGCPNDRYWRDGHGQSRRGVRGFSGRQMPSCQPRRRRRCTP